MTNSILLTIKDVGFTNAFVLTTQVTFLIFLMKPNYVMSTNTICLGEM